MIPQYDDKQTLADYKSLAQTELENELVNIHSRIEAQEMFRNPEIYKYYSIEKLIQNFQMYVADAQSTHEIVKLF